MSSIPEGRGQSPIDTAVVSAERQAAEWQVRAAYERGDFNNLPQLPPFEHMVNTQMAINRTLDKSVIDGFSVPLTLPAPVPARQAADRAVYTRQQKGHSLILHLLFGGFVLWIPAIYYTVSPNHFWHA